MNVIRAAARWARHVPDRLLHAARRRRAIQRLSTRAPQTFLFICHGNVCRSPFAAMLFAHERGASLEEAGVRSAGFIGPGRTPPAEAIAAAERFGVDVSGHRSSVFTENDVFRADVVVVMSAEQATGIAERCRDKAEDIIVLGDLDPFPIETRTITDPWGQADTVFDASFARIQRCVRALAEASRGHGD